MASASIDQPGSVREENRLEPAPLLAYLRRNVPELPDAPLEIGQFQAGASNLTYQLTIGPRQLILRRPPTGTKPRSGHDMHREYRVLSALHPHFPCPRPLAYCADETVIGAPFYVMEKLAGIILRRDPPPPGYTADAAHRLCRNLLDTQIRLHRLDYAGVGLDDLGHPQGYVQRQVEGWCQRFEKAWTDDVPHCRELMVWLRAEQPADTQRPSLIHNDYRFDNVVLDPEDRLSIIGVLDWEMCTIGDPLTDLGASLAYWVEADDPAPLQRLRMQPSQLPGMFSRAQILEYYARNTGLEITNPTFYYVFGLFRLAVIAQQIYYRYRLGETRNPRFQGFGAFVSVLSEIAERHIAHD